MERRGAVEKKEAEKEERRASTTDPDARAMRMADGGFRPAYFVQFATDTASQVIVGGEVTNRGNDAWEMTPMAEQLRRRYGKAPREWLADGGYLDRSDIEKLAEGGTDAFVPPAKSR